MLLTVAKNIWTGEGKIGILNIWTYALLRLRVLNKKRFRSSKPLRAETKKRK
jgi:hypothetical protein